LSFEGASSDVNETTFAITDPTADRTITFPDASGTVLLSGSVTVQSDGTTLLGDGTGGDQLRLNLGNANTWTGAQTLSAAANAIGDGTNAEQLQINGVAGGAVEVNVDGDADVSGTLDVHGASTFGDGDAGDVATVNTGAGTDLAVAEGGVDRSSASDETFAIDNSGAGNASLLLNGATSQTNSRLTVADGHWTSQGTVPTVSNPTGFTGGVSITANSTDVAGEIDGTTGGTATANSVIRVSFNQQYATAPIVLVTPRDATAGAVNYFVSATTTTTFDLQVINPANSTTYTFNYQVIEAQ
jgi:hypothetical protein